MIKSTIQYGYGNVFFYTDELKQNWEFVNLNNGTRKMIIKEGAFINYPGIENPEIVMKYYKNNASVINNFGFDSYCIAGKNEKPIIYWCIQKDAEQSTDKSSSDNEGQRRIFLYVYLDEYGNYKGKFRIYNIGPDIYIGTDREDKEAGVYKPQVIEKEKTDPFEEQYELIKSAFEDLKLRLDALPDGGNSHIKIISNVLPVIGREYTFAASCENYRNDNLDFVYELYVRLINSYETWALFLGKYDNLNDAIKELDNNDIIKEATQILRYSAIKMFEEE